MVSVVLLASCRASYMCLLKPGLHKDCQGVPTSVTSFPPTVHIVQVVLPTHITENQWSPSTVGCPHGTVALIG